MSERSEALAVKFEQANNDVISMVEQASDDQWKAVCEEEGWSVGVVAHHVGEGYPLITRLIKALGSGTEVPSWTIAEIDESNRDHAANFANVTREETLRELRSGGSAAASVVRSLRDNQLDRRAEVLGGALVSAEQVIENSLIGSTVSHLESIKKTL